MDPMTQSTQITSSQGLADGQNSAAKESKLSDSFLSSSPVSLIQSPQDKRVVLGSEKPCEGVATSLRFPSQPGSFTPGHYASEAGPPDGQPDSPIKTSPVSERIKALEALAAKKKEPDFRNEGGFSHFRDRHYEKSPTDIQKSPNEAQKSPNEAQKSPNDTPKSPTEIIVPTNQKKEVSVDKESPESPFEVLGDLRQVNEFEETEVWMKAHLPPVPDLDAVDLIKGTLVSNTVASKEKEETDIVLPNAPATFAGVPDAFMDSPIVTSELKDELKDQLSDAHKQEEEAEFDLSFLPTAYMWDQQEKPAVQVQANLDSELPASPAPPAGFDSPSPPVSPPIDMNAKQNVLHDKKTTWTRDPPEASEADSSGESDDTVIEDGVIIPASVPIASSDPAFSNDPTSAPASTAPSLPTEEKVTPPPKSERTLMQVPTINVIETDEPNYSEEEMEMELEVDEDEDYEVLKDSTREAPKTPEPEYSENEQPKTRPLETEFIEGYSPPSSPVDSDVEYSPKHKILKSLPEAYHQEPKSVPEAPPDPTVSKVSESDISQAHITKTQSTFNKANDEPLPFIVPKEEVDFPDNDDEWSDEAHDMLVKSCSTNLESKESVPSIQPELDLSSNTAVKETCVEVASHSKTSLIQDEIYDRESFDYDYDRSSPVDEQFLTDPSKIHIQTLNSSPAQSDVLENKQDCQTLDDFTSLNYCETLSSINEPDFNKITTTDNVSDNIANGNSLQHDMKPGVLEPEATQIPESIDPDSTVLERTDSFVEFMRECLKSREDEEPDNQQQSVLSESKFCETGWSVSQSTPTMVMDLEQEELTISALKELGSSQEEDELASLQSKVPDKDKANSNATVIEQSSDTSVPTPPCSKSELAIDSTYSKEVEAIDEWVAEAYHLAEHVLTAILTHLSVKDLINWRDPKKSGVVFGLSMLMLLSLAAFSVISVASYLLLALLCVTITFRIYKSVVQAVQKSSDGHPFKTLIDKDVSIPPETFRKHVDASLTYINRALKQMSRLFLVEDLVDSLKLAVVMWLLTYVGAVFNGITILILADILLFALPPVYEKNKTQIDQYIDVARTQVNTTMAKLQEKLPGAMKRSKTE
ncbi:reticulon-3 isoform X1 [Hippoglossus hippoglossus]|uniref:reticulon-3 isoform X1 n=1 Tax=Hippoglossus hippoglossus TaxID=8267 RepID=UPI00148B5C00|nr:reticulon-3 isoform X1 [Hippoglossus hippoglossus]